MDFQIFEEKLFKNSLRLLVLYGKLKVFASSRHWRKVERIEFSSNFFLLLSLISYSCKISIRCFFKKIRQKQKYYKEEKTDTERFLIFLNIKMSGKSKKMNSLKILQLCGEKNRPSGMTCSLHVETKMKKTKLWKECEIIFRFFKTDIFE